MSENQKGAAVAIEIRSRALAAIESLTEALDSAIATGDVGLIDDIKRGVGISIGTVDTQLLAALYRRHPELDHLKG